MIAATRSLMILSARRILLAGAAVLVLGACDSRDPLAPSGVIGTTWRLVSLQEAGAAAVVVPDPSRYTLQFGDEGRLSIRSDCNSCGGSYSLADSSLEVGPLACTRAYCGDTSLDARYTSLLQRARSVALSDGELTIQGNGATLRLRR